MEVPMVLMHCAKCGMPFCTTQNFRERRVQDGAEFWCPSGHANLFRDSESEQLKKKLADAIQQRNAKEQELADVQRKLKSELRKTKRAILNKKK